MKKKVFWLEFIRALSVVFIVIFHFNCSIGAHGVYMNSSSCPIIFYEYKNGNLGQIGVSLFFIISGTGLMLSNRENFNLKNYFKKRIMALYPMFYLAYFLVTGYYFMRYASLNPFGVPRSKISFVLTVLGLDGMLSPVIANYYVLGEWFLGAIIILYILFPALRLFLIKTPKAVAFIVMVIIYIVIVQTYSFTSYPIEYFALARSMEFFFGMFVAVYVTEVKRWMLIICSIILGCWFFIDIPLAQIYKTSIMGGVLFSIFAFIGQKIPSRIERIFKLIGKYSYPTFLLHHIVIEQIVSRFDNVKLSLFETYFLLLVVVGAIVLFVYLFNKIFLKIKSVIDMMKDSTLLVG